MTFNTSLRATLSADGHRKRLLLDERPFRVLGGELHNSSSSSTRAIRLAFESLAGSNINTVLAPVSWFQFEPREGEYDTSLIDELLCVSREHDLHLIPLWFGAWKNGRSSYMPPWVRADAERFPRAELTSGAHREHLSPFSTETAEADARAFAAFMRHLRAADANASTVLMVQVENEVGLLGDSRDRSTFADEHYHSPVPPRIFSILEDHPSLAVSAAWEKRGRPTRGSWPEVFGESVDTDEAFMATAYATHVERVAAAGKAEYPLPMFANAWLYTQLEVVAGTPAGGQTPGVYPSGGPLPHLGGIWTSLAPSLDLLAPDIYFGEFHQICRSYSAMSGGLFIPEMRRDEAGAANAFLAFGSFGAVGVSPFGVDTTPPAEGAAMSDAYSLLASVSDALFQSPAFGIHLDDGHTHAREALGEFIFSAERDANGIGAPVPHGYGVVIQETDDTFIIAGRGLILTCQSDSEAAAELVSVEELTDSDAGLVTERSLNGDETNSGSWILLPSLSAQLPSDEYRIPTLRRRQGIVRVKLAHAPRPTPGSVG